MACGSGALSAWLADHTTGQVIGVDLSDRQLAHARRRLAALPRPNLSFVQRDVMRLQDLAEPPFDAAICLDAACYLPDRPAALRAIATRLRPAGRLLLVDWCRAERVTALQQELILQSLCRYWAIPELETAAGYRRSFQRAGFHVHSVEDLSGRSCRTGSAATRQRCGPFPSRFGSITSCVSPPTRSSTTRSPSRQPETNSRSPSSPRPRPRPGRCATCPFSPNADRTESPSAISGKWLYAANRGGRPLIGVGVCHWTVVQEEAEASWQRVPDSLLSSTVSGSCPLAGDR